jgi:hypothetical protein
MRYGPVHHLDADGLPACGIEKVRLNWTRTAQLVTCQECSAAIQNGKTRQVAEALVGRIPLRRRDTGIDPYQE